MEAAVVVGGVKGSGIYVRLCSFLPPPVITRRPQWGGGGDGGDAEAWNSLERRPK